MQQTTPPSVEQLSDALAALRREDCIDSALHLALPRATAPSVEVRRLAGSMRWRNVSVPESGIQGVHLLGVLGWAEGDDFLDLEDLDPTQWVKPIPSGSHWVTFGTDVLLGLPLLRLPAVWTEDEVRAAVVALYRGEIPATGTYKDHKVVATSSYWTLEAADLETSHVADICASLQATLECEIRSDGDRLFASTSLAGVRVDLGILRDGCVLDQDFPDRAASVCPPGWEVVPSSRTTGRVRHTASGMHGAVQVRDARAT